MLFLCMPWRGHVRNQCKVCERPRESDELFSARGKCPACGHTLMVDNLVQLKEHSGPHFTHWRRSIAASVGAVLPDE